MATTYQPHAGEIGPHLPPSLVDLVQLFKARGWGITSITAHHSMNASMEIHIEQVPGWKPQKTQALAETTEDEDPDYTVKNLLDGISEVVARELREALLGSEWDGYESVDGSPLNLLRRADQRGEVLYQMLLGIGGTPAPYGQPPVYTSPPSNAEVPEKPSIMDLLNKNVQAMAAHDQWNALTLKQQQKALELLEEGELGIPYGPHGQKPG